MDVFEMVVAIVAIAVCARLVKYHIDANAGVTRDEDGNPVALVTPDADRLRDEVRTLKERVAVLEKIATDERGPRELTNEIERLRG